MPINPTQAALKKSEVFPKEVFDAFDELIVKNLVDGRACVRQKDVIKLIKAKLSGRERDFETHWLNVEEAYRRVGWTVEYKKPGLDETFDASFTFTATPEHERHPVRR